MLRAKEIANPGFALAIKPLQEISVSIAKTSEHTVSQHRTYTGEQRPQIVSRVSAQIDDPAARLCGIKVCNYFLQLRGAEFASCCLGGLSFVGRNYDAGNGLSA